MARSELGDFVFVFVLSMVVSVLAGLVGWWAAGALPALAAVGVAVVACAWSGLIGAVVMRLWMDR